MKITIDTKEDSHHEIQKAITLLQSLISGRVRNSNVFEDDTPTLPAEPSSSSEGGIFNMFGDNSNIPKPEPSEVIPKPEPSEVDEKDDVQLMEY